MRKKLQDKMFEVSYLFELLISVIVGVAILIFAVRLVVDMFDMSLYSKGAAALVTVLDDAIILAIGAELIKMLCKHTPETVIEVLAFALARQLIVGHAAPLENLITVVAIAVLFAVRRFLLNRHDMVETPDGLVEIEEKEEVPDVIPF
ncbi:MAG: transporter [Oscillospiraceae bacterium]|nr:transporter [Oscillospiraceae bacterium]MBQ3224100.1 transporter [Oscillospiraceae bacterium]